MKIIMVQRVAAMDCSSTQASIMYYSFHVLSFIFFVPMQCTGAICMMRKH